MMVSPCSVIIPVYNEKENIKNFLDKIFLVLKNNFIDFEVIVVDDGSVDGSSEILKNDNRIKLVSHIFRRGYGSAVKTGIRSSKYEFVIIIDGDGTYPVEDIPKFVEYLKDNDMIVGVRPIKKISVIRRPTKWLLNRMANYFAGTKFPDLNSGFRAFKKSIVEKYFHILPEGFSFTTTITLVMHSEGYLLQYLPINYFKRKGKSKINPIRDMLNFIQLIIRTVLYFNPLKIFLPISLSLFFAGLILLLYRAFVARAFVTTIVVLFVSAIQVLAIGMLADLINRKIK